MICIGDSLTCGMIGYSYIEYCQYDEKILNRGVNGDTTRCAYQRLQRYLDTPSYEGEELYVIAIGTNDILLPYLSGISSAWKAETSLRCRIKKSIEDDQIFRQEYTKFFLTLHRANKKMITIGLPYIQLVNYPHDDIIRRNNIIRELSEHHGVPFIDIYSIQAEAIEVKNIYTWKHRNLIRLVDNLAMLIYPPLKDILSRGRRLELTVDGVHYNSFSAELLGRALSECISNIYIDRGRMGENI